MAALFEVSHLTVGYGYEGEEPVQAVQDLSFTVEPGEVVGIAGESGCGKSTLALAATGLLDPPGRVSSGTVRFDGEDLLSLSPEALRRLRLRHLSLVFQASMNVLNPVLRIRDQFFDAMEAHGVTSRREALERTHAVFDMVKVPRRFVDAYPHQLSGGMRQRAVIALSLVLEPRLVFMDEPTTALDVVVQRAILQSVNDLRERRGFSVVFITHDLSLLVEIADRIVIMYAGFLVEEAAGQELYERPLHPYTRALMRAFPPLGEVRTRLEGIPGQPPDLRRLPPGCPFYPRCKERLYGVCDEGLPPVMWVSPGHRVRCHLYPGEGERDGKRDGTGDGKGKGGGHGGSGTGDGHSE